METKENPLHAQAASMGPGASFCLHGPFCKRCASMLGEADRELSDHYSRYVEIEASLRHAEIERRTARACLDPWAVSGFQGELAGLLGWLGFAPDTDDLPTVDNVERFIACRERPVEVVAQAGGGLSSGDRRRLAGIKSRALAIAREAQESRDASGYTAAADRCAESAAALDRLAQDLIAVRPHSLPAVCLQLCLYGVHVAAAWEDGTFDVLLMHLDACTGGAGGAGLGGAS